MRERTGSGRNESGVGCRRRRTTTEPQRRCVCVGRAGRSAKRKTQKNHWQRALCLCPVSVCLRLSLSRLSEPLQTTTTTGTTAATGTDGDGRGRTRMDGGISRVSIAKYMCSCLSTCIPLFLEYFKYALVRI